MAHSIDKIINKRLWNSLRMLTTTLIIINLVKLKYKKKGLTKNKQTNVKNGNKMKIERREKKKINMTTNQVQRLSHIFFFREKVFVLWWHHSVCFPFFSEFIFMQFSSFFYAYRIEIIHAFNEFDFNSLFQRHFFLATNRVRLRFVIIILWMRKFQSMDASVSFNTKSNWANVANL